MRTPPRMIAMRDGRAARCWQARARAPLSWLSHDTLAASPPCRQRSIESLRSLRSKFSALFQRKIPVLRQFICTKLCQCAFVHSETMGSFIIPAFELNNTFSVIAVVCTNTGHPWRFAIDHSYFSWRLVFYAARRSYRSRCHSYSSKSMLETSRSCIWANFTRRSSSRMKANSSWIGLAMFMTHP